MKRINPNLRFARTDGAGESAFTRLELLAVIVTLVLVAGVVIPAFAQSKPRSQQAVCFNNLRLVGQAFLLFNAENNQKDPWWSLSRNHSSGLQNNQWFQLAYLSNSLSTPKVFACPSDAAVRPARDFRGFVGNNGSISYFLGLDSSALVPDSVLSGDRNLKHDSVNAGCSSGISPAASINIRQESPTAWRGGLHGAFGNILLHDGRVEQTSNQTINRWFKPAIEDQSGFIHLMMSRY